MSRSTLYAGDDASREGELLRLGPEEARHVRALRLDPGAEVRVTDGAGGLWVGRLESAGRDEVRVRLQGVAAAPPPIPVELAFGVASRDPTLWLVEKAVELGAVTLQPVAFTRSRSVADAAASREFWAKARRRAVAALKQCGGDRLPEIRPVVGLAEYLEARSDWPGPAVWLSRKAGTTLRGALAGWHGRNPARVLLGPEGGATAEEVARCRDAGWRSARLGRRILRFETAAVAALAVAAQELEREEPEREEEEER